MVDGRYVVMQFHFFAAATPGNETVVSGFCKQTV
jgi:hypothetical protein